MTENCGYTGKILRVDLSSGSITETSTMDYVDRFLGGRGLAAKIYWDEAPPEVSPFHPENRLIFATGPLAGLSGVHGSRWQVCGKSPATTPEHFCYSNLGGTWGANLKFAGYDALVVQGKSDRPIYLFIQDGVTDIRDASHLWCKSTTEVREILKGELGSSVTVVATGPAGENEVVFATILADEDAVGCCGIGAVMGSKKLKAIAVRGSRKVKVADPQKFQELTRHISELTRRSGFTVLPEITDDALKRMKRGYCYGCKSQGFCDRFIYRAQNGREGKFMCGAAAFYVPWSQRYYGEWNDVPFFATKLCDDYGLDTSATKVMITWLSDCFEAGILTDENTGIPLSKLGSLEFIEALLKKIAYRDGFGETLARGTIEAANSVGVRAKELITDYTFKGQTAVYTPRTYITTGLLWAMEPRRPIQQLHEVVYVASYPWMDWVNKKEHSYLSTDAVRTIARKFWGSELAADFSTYEGKALAAKKIQDRRMVEESLILCDLYWPILSVEFSENHVGDPSLESKLFSAVTGKEVDEEELYAIGERIWNLQRAILIREGDKGRESDIIPEFWYTIPVESEVYNPECLVPGKDGEIVSKIGTVVDREKFEKLKDEYYRLRGWDVATGLQTRAKLEQIGLQDIVADLERRELLIKHTAQNIRGVKDQAE